MNIKSIAALLFVAALIQGCATPARVDQMTIRSTEMPSQSAQSEFANKLTVTEVSGGEKTNPLWTSQIGNEEFKQALIESLHASRLLSDDSESADYELQAQLMNLIQPAFGLDFKVEATIRYILMDKKSHEKIFEEVVKSDFTATFSDAAYGVERLKIANEGAARTNIKHLIFKLYDLKIEKNISMK